VDRAAFVYDVELLPGQNPPGTFDRLQEGIRAFFVDRRLDYGMGALGGSRHCYGHVVAPGRLAAEDVRRSLAEWVRGLRFRGVARLGPVGPAEPPPALNRTNTSTVVEVDNLTEADKAEAVAYFADLRRRVESLRKRPT
jgi:hypothetical protein